MGNKKMRKKMKTKENGKGTKEKKLRETKK